MARQVQHWSGRQRKRTQLSATDAHRPADTLRIHAARGTFAGSRCRSALMTLAGWIFMSVSLTAVLALVVWCYYRLLRAPRQ